MLKRFPGKCILALALALPALVLADVNGTVTIPASFNFSLDNGAVGTAAADVQWDLTTPTIRAIVAVGNARLVNLGNLGLAGFGALQSSSLSQFPYISTSINGNNDSTNLLVAGDVFLVRTNAGNYAKVLVTGYHTNASNPSAQDIQVEYFTYGQEFPHLAMGPLGTDVWTTSIVLNNTTSSPANVTLKFFQDTGQPLPLGTGIYTETPNGNFTQTPNGDSLFGSIAPGSTSTIVLSAATFVEGWASLTGPGISGQAVFHRHTLANGDYEAAVPLATGGTEYLVPFDATAYFNGSASVPSLPYITGMALVNLDSTRIGTISCIIYNFDGSSLGPAIPISLAPLGHIALQLNAASGFTNVNGKIGTLDCSSSGTSFALLGLRFLGVNGLTSFAAIRLQ